MRMAGFTRDEQQEITACVDLVGRSGAKDFELGHLHDAPVPEAGWFATATYRGAKLIAEGHTGPVQAAQALARRVLVGALCVCCRHRVTLATPGAAAFGLTHSGSGGQQVCVWVRRGDRWVSGCRGGEG
ncbi:hypothetical protein ACFVWN_20395 [Nocardiopsis flavescens]|uniref:hypothetical protein n=1 Tax=Nocardiopsis flavescens TaxID=758803 RepID=UPI00364A25FC